MFYMKTNEHEKKEISLLDWQSVFHIFQGIPYAVPPVKDRRWKEPEMLSKSKGTCWDDIYKAKSYKQQCIQKDFLTERISGYYNYLFVMFCHVESHP